MNWRSWQWAKKTPEAASGGKWAARPGARAFVCFVCLVAQSCLTLCDPMDCSPPVLLSMEFSRQEYLSGLPFPPPGGLPDPRISSLLCLLHWQADSLPSEPPGKSYSKKLLHLITTMAFRLKNACSQACSSDSNISNQSWLYSWSQELHRLSCVLLC